MKKVMFAVAAFSVALCFAGTTTTVRDGQGRVVSTVTVDKNGKTTYRDGLGRIQGTLTTDRSGKTTYRDAQGRVIWTKTVR